MSFSERFRRRAKPDEDLAKKMTPNPFLPTRRLRDVGDEFESVGHGLAVGEAGLYQGVYLCE